MIVVTKCPCRHSKGNAVCNYLLVVCVKFVRPPPNCILTAFSVICISRLFFISYQQHIVPFIGCQRAGDVDVIRQGEVPGRHLVTFALHRYHPNLHISFSDSSRDHL